MNKIVTTLIVGTILALVSLIPMTVILIGQLNTKTEEIKKIRVDVQKAIEDTKNIKQKTREDIVGYMQWKKDFCITIANAFVLKNKNEGYDRFLNCLLMK